MNRTHRYVLIAIIGVAVLCMAAFFVGSYFSDRVEKTQRNILLRQAQDAALLVDGNDLSTLAANESDLSNSVYVELKEKLTAFRSHDEFVRFVYVLGYRPDLKIQFFYVDSEPIESEDYSPPGQLFADTREYDIEQYLAGIPYTDGPYSDSWGTWVSGYAPVLHDDGSVAGLVGIDVSTDVWRDQINYIFTTSVIITLLFIILFLVLVYMLWKKDFSIGMLSDKNRTLEQKGRTLEEIQALGHLGKITMYLSDDAVKIDGQFAPLLGASAFTVATFINTAHPDDRAKVEQAINEMRSSDHIYTWFDARFGGAQDGYRLCHIYGAIDRADGLRFSGIMQDISELRA